MRFAYPELLWLLALLPLLALLRGRRGPSPTVLYSSTDLVRGVSRGRRSRAGRWLTTFRLLALAPLIVALARPQQGLGQAEVESSGIDIVLAIDVSGSMKARDFELGGKPASRLDVVKTVVRRFVDARPSDRIGMVAFAGRPYLVSPLTLDHDWLLQNMDRLEIGLVEDGTAIGSAIAASANRLRDRPAKSKIVILLTDGVNNSGKVSPATAAAAAGALGVKVYTIAAGTRGQAPIPAVDAFGREHIVMAHVDVDEETLKHVAETTHARFYRATDTDSLDRIYAEIDKLEKTTVEMKRFERYHELFGWALVPGVFLLGLEVVLGETRLRRLP
jgi:Ca-activated chloride channel family protein